MSERLCSSTDSNLLRVVFLAYRQRAHERCFKAFAGIAALWGCSNHYIGLCFAGSTDAFARNKHPRDNSDKNYDCY